MQELEDLLVWINRRRIQELDLSRSGNDTDWHFAKASAFEEVGDKILSMAQPMNGSVSVDNEKATIGGRR